MIDYLYIQPIFDAGTTDPDAIAAALNADGRMRKDILLSELSYVLNEREIRNTVTGQGSLARMRAALQDGSETALAVDRWIGHIADPRQTVWRTTIRENADPFLALYQTFNNPPNDQVFNIGDLDAVYELGGGRLFGTVTGTEVSKSIAEHKKQSVLDAFRMRAAAAVEAAEMEARKQSSTAASVVSAGESAFKV